MLRNDLCLVILRKNVRGISFERNSLNGVFPSMQSPAPVELFIPQLRIILKLKIDRARRARNNPDAESDDKLPDSGKFSPLSASSLAYVVF